MAIYVTRKLKAFEINDSILKNREIEQIWCEVKSPSNYLIIGCLYRPPLSNRDYSRRMFESIKRAASMADRIPNCSILMMGDFNLPDQLFSLEKVQETMSS